LLSLKNLKHYLKALQKLSNPHGLWSVFLFYIMGVSDGTFIMGREVSAKNY
jgi:hypothetical protein